MGALHRDHGSEDLPALRQELYEKDFNGQTAIYWEVKYPFPLSNRDYVYMRERRDLDVDGRKIWVILARSSPDTPCAEKSGVLRVKDYKQSVALESDGAGGTKERSSRFLNGHAEGLQQLQQLLPEEMNAADGTTAHGTTAHAQGLTFTFPVLFLGVFFNVQSNLTFLLLGE
ncbi:phosphatidylcholine transfer protein isoform X3 [Morone saxatilis]|uniref:phosphatidylcholine transfer protein isoform X3 n=1 Tax=Morone saxatilis TaxID=34816 RepID=UPI0015E219C9|nr:phosphatidylcholine transfer protein isoform X3 [Morone saxatilis]